MNSNTKDRFRGCLLGLACGDAVGTTLEFRKRGTFKPITDMVGGGPFGLPVGAWTDDTSMALCLAESLIARKKMDPKDQMDRYLRWFISGYMSSIGHCFDIGTTTSCSLDYYQRTGNPITDATDDLSSSNGSIMRLAPVPMFFYPDFFAAVNMSGESSKTTHGSTSCIDACRLLGGIIHAALSGVSKNTILMGHNVGYITSDGIKSIANGTYMHKNEHEIRGTGQVTKSLEAALWCFWNSSDFKSAVLMAANLGDDADTTAAITGQVAGAHYGESGIPDNWLHDVFMRHTIADMADQLYFNKGRSL